MNVQTMKVLHYEIDIPWLRPWTYTPCAMKLPTLKWNCNFITMKTKFGGFRQQRGLDTHTHTPHYEMVFHNYEMTHPCFFWRLGLDTHTLKL